MKTIEQGREFPVSPEELFDSYLDSRIHSAITGSKARIGKKAGEPFSAFEGELTGRNLLIVPKKMIVQAWRSSNFHKNDPDSILVLTFHKTAKGGKIKLYHVNVPEQDYKGVKDGWPAYYWKPWEKYLSAQKNRR